MPLVLLVVSFPVKALFQETVRKNFVKNKIVLFNVTVFYRFLLNYILLLI